MYNWTDSPSIISEHYLLILDAHHEWSEGGPIYDFIKDAEDEAIKNQMAAFHAILEDPSRLFKGTIIRIPLRTREHASESKISNRETTVSEVREVLEKFGAEFGDSGLLFMRNIERVLIDSTSDISISTEIVNSDYVRK